MLYSLESNLTFLPEPDIAMRVNLLIFAGLVLAVCGLCTLGCKKAEKATTKLDPHSADGIMAAAKEQVKQFSEAVARQDWQYLHDYGYYFTGIIVSFSAKLDEGDRQRLRAPVQELLALTQRLDRERGSAAEATVKRIEGVLNDLDQQYQQGKASGSTK